MFAGEWMLDHHCFQLSQLGSTITAPLGWYKWEYSSCNYEPAGFWQVFTKSLIILI